MANFSPKLASTVSAAAIVASAMGASLVSAASEFLPYAEALAAKKVINSQNAESGYRLNDQITRAELAKVAANLGGYTAVKCTGNVYTDVTASLGDLCDAIETLAAAKVISTASNTFRPTANVTRAEMTKMILGALAVAPSSTSAGFSDVNSSLGDLEGFINAAAEKNIVNKATYFRPNATGSRGEVFKIAARAAKLEVKTPDNKPEVQAGNVTISAVGSATAQYVPRNASSVNVGTVKLTANDGDIKVSSLSVARSGLGDPTDITISKGVRAMVNGKIVSGNADYYNSSSQQANIYFVPALEIKKGQSVDVSVLMSLGNMQGSTYKPAQPNSQHQFTVTGVNGTNIASPVTLGLVNTTSYDTTSVTAQIEKVTSNLIPAQTNQRLVDVKIGGADRDVTVTGFNIARSNETDPNTKKAAYDLTTVIANPKVYLDGKEVGKVTMTRDKIFVTDLNTTITSGRKTFQLRADTLLDTTMDQLVLEIEDSSDVSGYETATRSVFRVDPKGKAYLNRQSVNNNFVANTTKKTVAMDSSNVELYNATLTSDVPLVVNKVNVKAINSTYQATTGEVPNFSRGNLTLKNNGRTIAVLNAKDVFTNDGKDTSAYFLVDKDNKANLTIEADLQNKQKGTIKFEVTIKDIKDVNNRPANIDSDSAEGGVTTVKGADVRLTQANTSSNYRLEANNDLTYTFTLRAENEDAEIDGLTLANAVEAAHAADLAKVFDIRTSKIKIGGKEVKFANTSTATEIKFTNTVTLDKDQDTVVELRLKTKDGADFDSQKGKGVQLKLTSINKGTDKVAEFNRVISAKVNVGNILDVSAMNGNAGAPVKFNINNSTENDVTLTKATLEVAATAIVGNNSEKIDVTSLKVNGVVVDALPGKKNEFTISGTKLEEIGIDKVSKNNNVELSIENNTLTASSNVLFTVRLKTLEYDGVSNEVNVDASSRK